MSKLMLQRAHRDYKCVRRRPWHSFTVSDEDILLARRNLLCLSLPYFQCLGLKDVAISSGLDSCYSAIGRGNHCDCE